MLCFPGNLGLEGNNMICQTVKNTKEKQVINCCSVFN